MDSPTDTSTDDPADTSDRIIRDLATRDLVVDISPEYGLYVCLGCPDDDEGVFSSQEEVVHAEGCVGRRAREYMEGLTAKKGGG